MRIEAVDFFYLSMPEMTDRRWQPGRAAGACRGWRAYRLGRVRSGAAGLDRGLRLPDVARRVQAGRRLGAGQALDDPADIARMSAEVADNSLDLLQAAHTCPASRWRCGICSASARGEPVWTLLGYRAASRRRPMRRSCSAIRRRKRSTRARDAARGRFPRGEVRLGPDRARQRRQDDRSTSSPRARGSARTASCWLTPGRSSSTTSSAPRSGCRRSRRARATWLEEPFARARSKPTAHCAKRSAGEARRRRRRAQSTWRSI